MNVQALGNYSNWIGKPALDIYVAVLRAGGWKNVFPDRVPRWASRVRNYFNLSPCTLERTSGEVAKRAMQQQQRFKFQLECHEVQTFNKYHRNYRPNPNGKLDPPPFAVPEGCSATASYDVVHTGLTDSIAVKKALTGVVYKDETGRLWFQMAPGSTIYHWGTEVSGTLEPMVDASYVEIRGQDFAPVFKLISPDNTGGSVECILANSRRQETIVATGKRVSVGSQINTDVIHQGSYNYSETAHMGLAAHELRDVKTHVAKADFYLNPSDRFSKLSNRYFPDNDSAGRPLSSQR